MGKTSYRRMRADSIASSLSNWPLKRKSRMTETKMQDLG